MDAAQPPPKRLRVMSYNIQAGKGADRVCDLERTAVAIESQQADVVVLQEVDVHWSARSGYLDQAEWLASRLRMRVFYAPVYTLPPDRPGGPERQFGLAVLSRLPMAEAHNHTMTRLSSQVPNPVAGPAPGFPEVLVSVGDARVWIYGAHLDYRADPVVRHQQVADLLCLTKRRRGVKILMGDLNAGPDSAELAPLWDQFSDTLTEVGRRTTPTWPSHEPVKRLDYITVSPGADVATASVPRTLASDHLPVVSDVVIHPESA